MGVFSATGVGAHDPDPNVADGGHGVTDNEFENVDPHDLLSTTGIVIALDDDITDEDVPETTDGTSWTNTAALSNTGDNSFEFDQHEHEYTLDTLRIWDTLFLTVTGDAGVDEDEITVEVNGEEITAAQLDLTPAVPLAETATAVVYRVDVTSYLSEIKITADGADNTNGPGAYTIAVTHDLATDKTSPGSSQSLTVESAIDHAVADNIIVKLEDFGVPSSIDADDVRVTIEGATPDSGSPSDIEIDGTTVTLMGPIVDGNGDNIAPVDITGATIDFRRGAGITLPIRDGNYDVKVESEDEDDDGVQNWVTVRREVSVKPTSGKRGTEITISGKGFADGTADIEIGGMEDFTTAEVSDGTFSVTVDTAAKVDGDNVFDGATTGTDEDEDRKTSINASDAVGNTAEKYAEFEIKPSFTVSPDNPLSGADITLTLVDLDVPSGTAVMVSFAGGTAEEATADATTTANDWKVTVPDKVRIGTIQVKVTVGDDTLTQNITIGTNDLTVSPTTVVPRQEISIDGGGFTSKDVPRSESDNDDKENTIAANTVEVGGIPATHGEQPVNNNGDISFNITVPDAVTPGTRTVEVTDVAGRVGVAEITVAKPEITLNPAEGLIGSELTVSGTGFPANDLVLIKYGGNTVDTSATSSTGTFEQVITVPSGNSPGATPEILAEAQVQVVPAGQDKASAKAEHKLPNAVITLSPDEVAAGDSLTISGSNFEGFVQTYRVEVGGQNVTPVPAPSTDKWGTVSATVQVPQLTPGRYAVSLRVIDAQGTSATEFIQVVTETVEVSTAPADVFADLIAADRLERVWYLIGATQMWEFYDPDPELASFNNLDEITVGEAYIVIVSEGDPIEFQGRTLYAGSNNIPIR